jgi:flagellin
MRNILESNTRSLAIQRENLAATESNIRDVDVAAEMATFTRFQILQQSGVAMLAQANQAPQAVLRLLQG